MQLWISDERLTVRNSTFVGNSAAAWRHRRTLTANCFSSAGIRLTHVTAVGNSVTNTASGLVDRVACTARNAPLEIRNSVFTGNTGRECRSFSNPSSPSQAQLDATTITNTYIEDGSCNIDFNSTNNGAARLGSQQTTGRGQIYYVPQSGSPLIDAGAAAHCLERDQLGRSRSVGASCDLGAIEVQPPPRPVRRTVATRRSGPKPFRETCKTDLPVGISLSATPRGIQCQALTPAGVGNDAVIAAGYLAAVDIWGDIGTGLEVCFNQAGRLLLLDAATAPRTLGRAIAHSRRCDVDLRLAGSSRHRRPAAGGRGAHGGEPQQRAGGRAELTAAVTTTEVLRFRSTPGIGDNIIGYIRAGARLQAEARTSRWFRVTAAGLTGWISADYAASAGSCG